MSEFVTADAQFGIENVLRPFEDFEDVYQGENVNRLIMFTKPKVLSGAWSNAYDELAGTTGYRTNFVRGLRVPYGARVIVKIPMVHTQQDTDVATGYHWVLWWRSRTLYDYRNIRMPWHFPTQSPFEAEPVGTFIPTPVVRNSIVYNQVESGYLQQVQHIKPDEVMQIYNNDIGLDNPLMPTGDEGIIEQPGYVVSSEGAGMPNFASIEVSAIGDELLVGMYRSDLDGAYPTWDFADGQIDERVALAFGKSDPSGPFNFMGPIVSYGTSP